LRVIEGGEWEEGRGFVVVTVVVFVSRGEQLEGRFGFAFVGGREVGSAFEGSGSGCKCTRCLGGRIGRVGFG
jgi:hypothetical protein